jgi:capsular polysaccharide biosynthesis protein
MSVEEKKVYSSFVSKRNKPVNINKEDEFLFKHEYEYEVPVTFIKKIINADVLKDTIFDISTLRFFPSETHVYGSFSRKQKINYLLKFTNKKAKLDKGIWVTQNWTWMYFHWLTDALTRLIASENYLDSHKVILPASYEQFSFISESLEFLGYSIYWLKEDVRLNVKELILPSHTASPGNFNDEILKKVRSKFSIRESSNSRLIYISRAKATQRHVENEVELIDLLVSYGFEIHVFEEYSFVKQVELMNETSVLIGLHGAGLTNMLFMNSGGKVMEIRNQNDTKNNCYFSMSSALDLDYYYVEGVSESENTSNAIINVDIKNIETIVQQMLLKR